MSHGVRVLRTSWRTASADRRRTLGERVEESGALVPSEPSDSHPSPSAGPRIVPQGDQLFDAALEVAEAVAPDGQDLPQGAPPASRSLNT